MDTDLIIIAFLLLFLLLVTLIFGWRRRWMGLAGWSLVVAAFIINLLMVRTATRTQSILSAIAIVVGFGLAGIDYLRYDRRGRRWHRLPRLPFAAYRSFTERRKARQRRRAFHE